MDVIPVSRLREHDEFGRHPGCKAGIHPRLRPAGCLMDCRLRGNYGGESSCTLSWITEDLQLYHLDLHCTELRTFKSHGSRFSNRFSLMVKRATTTAVIPVLLLLLSSAVSGCSLTEEELQQPVDRWIAMTAVYEESLESGAPVQRVALVNFDDPRRYRILARDSLTAAHRPRLSPNREWLVVENHVTSFGSSAWLNLINVTSEVVIPLLSITDGPIREAPLYGTLSAHVWKPDGTGFYGTRFEVVPVSFEYWAEYDGESYGSDGTQEATNFGLPYGLKGADSLLVLAAAPDGSSSVGFHFLNGRTYDYLEPIDNQHLQFVPRAGNPGTPEWDGWKHQVHNPALNNESGLIAYRLIADAEEESSPSRRGIAVTNMDGTFYREFDSGDFFDGYPRWGPGGTVLLDRRPLRSKDWRDHRVMVLDIETGEIRELVEPHIIDGAAGLRLPDY